MVWCLYPVQTPTPIVLIQIVPTMGGNDLITLVGNLVRSALGVPPQYQESLHDATVPFYTLFHVTRSAHHPSDGHYRIQVR